MGACVTNIPAETTITTSSIPASTTSVKPNTNSKSIDYYSIYPWSKNVLCIISYWNRMNKSHSIELNRDVESMIQRFSLNDLILKEWSYVTFKSNHLYEFSNIIIQNKAVLTVESYDITNPNGGKLLLRSYGDFIVETGGVIDCNGTGYSGGDRWYSGLSYKGQTIHKQQEPNYGGGGCTLYYSALWCLSSGGGGYATKGEDGLCRTFNGKEYHFEGVGGGIYGDKELTVLHLGSGGGGSRFCKGGNGGGALKIVCNKFINKGTIQMEGIRGGGATKNGGGGAGGSCLIIVHGNQFDNQHGIISCVGAESIHQFGTGGSGGDGRICIKIARESNGLNDFARRSAERVFDSDGDIMDTKSGHRLVRFGDIEPKPNVIHIDRYDVELNVNDRNEKVDNGFLYERTESILDSLFVQDHVKSLDEIDVDVFAQHEPSAVAILDYRLEEKVGDIEELSSELETDTGIGNEGQIMYEKVYEWLNTIALDKECTMEYYSLFVKNGFDNVLAIQHITEIDLERMGIDEIEDRENVMSAVDNLYTH